MQITPDTSLDTDTADAPKEAPVQAQWEYKEEFGIVTQLREAILLTKAATEKELEMLHKKLDRLTYGG